VARSRGVGRARGSCEGVQLGRARGRLGHAGSESCERGRAGGRTRPGWLSQLVGMVGLDDGHLIHHPG
jgi:hypothetical protein